VLEVLDPLEVGDHHAARIGEHVGHDEDALVVEDLIRLRGGRAVRAFDHHPALHPVGVLLVDHPAERSRDEDVALERDQVVRVDLLSARVEVGDLAAVAHVLRELVGVDPVAAGDRPARVRHADHPRAELLHQPRGPRAHVSESLHHEGRIGRIQVDLGSGFAEDLDDPAAGGGLAPE
jgi:hypothetical protein